MWWEGLNMSVIFFDFLCLGVLACSGDCFGNVCFSGLATLLWLSVVLIMRQSRWCCQCRGKFILDVTPNIKAADTLNCWWLDWTGSGRGIRWLAQLEWDCPLCVFDCWKLGCSLVLFHTWDQSNLCWTACTQYLVGLIRSLRQFTLEYAGQVMGALGHSQCIWLPNGRVKITRQVHA